MTVEDETIKLEEYWQLRDKQMREDRAILNLVKPTAETDAIKWISNEPKVFYETATSLISSYQPRFRLPLTIDFEPEEKKKMNKAERLILGIFRNLDARQRQNTWLRELSYRILSGWYSVFVWVRRNGDSVDFIADIWDPITVYPEWDADGLTKCVRSYTVSKPMAEKLALNWQKKGLKFKFEPKHESALKVINFWKDDRGKIYNTILLDGQEIKPWKEEKQFGHIPIFTGAIGVPDRTSEDWPSRFGESIIAANRDMYEYENTMVSLMATIMAETAYPNLLSKTQTGAPVTKKPLKGYGEEIPLKLNQTLEILKHAATPAEVNVLIGWASKQKQKGSVPEIVYGGVPFELSGFAISQLMAAIRYKIAPYLNIEELAISRIASELLEQYKKGDGKRFPKISLSTVNPAEMRKGLFFVEEFSPSDVPDVGYVEVTIPITSAMDKTQQIQFARQALAPPQILSMETLWDDVLDVQDSEQEYARIIQDQMLQDPFVRDIAIVEQLREREKLYRSKGMIPEAGAMHRYIMTKEMQLGMRQGVPESSTGVDPSFSPPEAGDSPDVNRAIQGLPPPGPNRRLQSAEERAESKGRKGGLVTPSGDTLL